MDNNEKEEQTTDKKEKIKSIFGKIAIAFIVVGLCLSAYYFIVSYFNPDPLLTPAFKGLISFTKGIIWIVISFIGAFIIYVIGDVIAFFVK